MKVKQNYWPPPFNNFFPCLIPYSTSPTLCSFLIVRISTCRKLFLFLKLHISLKGRLHINILEVKMNKKNDRSKVRRITEAEAEWRRGRELKSTMKVPYYSLESSRAGFVYRGWRLYNYLCKPFYWWYVSGSCSCHLYNLSQTILQSQIPYNFLWLMVANNKVIGAP